DAGKLQAHVELTQLGEIEDEFGDVERLLILVEFERELAIDRKRGEPELAETRGTFGIERVGGDHELRHRNLGKARLLGIGPVQGLDLELLDRDLLLVGRDDLDLLDNKAFGGAASLKRAVAHFPAAPPD